MTVYHPGDIGLSSSPGVLGKLIRTGERMTVSKKYGHWNHAFVIVDELGNTIEAGSKGVVRNNISTHPDHMVIPCPAQVDRLAVINFAFKSLGIEYGYLDDVLLGFDCLTHLKLHEHGDSMICSELVSYALNAGGWRSPKLPALMMPSDVALAILGA